MTANLTRRAIAGVLTVRAGEERIIEGIVVPFGVTIKAPDGNYRETIPASAVRGLVPGNVRLESGAHNAPLVGIGREAEVRPEGLHMAFEVARTAAGDEALENARLGIYGDMSIGFRPISQRKLSGGVVERTAIDIRRVAILESGAYPGAVVTAVRAEEEGEEVTDSTISLSGTITEDIEPAAAPAAAPAEAPRSAAVPELVARAASSPAIVTRAEMIYRPGNGQSFLGDAFRASAVGGNNSEAHERQARHYAMIEDLVQRAGDVLSTEIPGAYPTETMPGLFVPRILQGRPMASFYNRVGIADARPRVFAQVTTGTTVAAQSAEGANPAASDFATTAITVTPALGGGETVVSRQVLDGADPAAESMIMSDLLEAYARYSEGIVRAAVEAGSTAQLPATVGATPYVGLVGQVIGYQGARFSAPQSQFLGPVVYGNLLTQSDGVSGSIRPIVPFLGPVNTDGQVQAGAAGASIIGVPTILSWASTPGAATTAIGGVVVTGRPEDFVIYESSVFRFSFDQVTGPAGIRLGVWAYLAVAVHNVGGSKKVTLT